MKIKPIKFICFFLLFSFLFFFCFLFSRNTFSAELINYSVTISDSRPGQENVSHLYQWQTATSATLRCITLESCTSYTGPCNVPSGLDTTGATKGSFVGLSASNWNLDTSANGLLKLTNSSGETPGANVALEFNGIKNPDSRALVLVRIRTFSDESCTSEVDYGYASFQTVPGVSVTATVSPPPTTANLIFEGKAGREMIIYFFRNGILIGTAQANLSGYFSKTFTGLLPGNFTFSLYGEDSSGRRTSAQYYTLTLVAGVTTRVSGIFLSPTISVSKDKVYKGDYIRFYGKTFPNSIVYFLISPGNILRETLADSQGNYSYNFNTSILGKGSYNVRARASYAGEYSDFSESKVFEVIEKKPAGVLPTPTPAVICRGADLNFDGKVNIVDFSILMYFWGQTKPANSCANINQKDTVDIVDFSIMMYQWRE